MTVRRLRMLMKAAGLTVVTAIVLAWVFLAYLSPNHLIDWLVMNSFCT